MGGKDEAVSLLGEARQDSKCSRLLVKCDNRPETVSMKVSNEDGVSVTVATRAAAIRQAKADAHQGKTETARSRRGSFSEAKASQ